MLFIVENNLKIHRYVAMAFLEKIPYSGVIF